tara:strand:- start:85 stop:1158 length:1074 start_codon:yes stop_codon:yes gene_type:complete
MKKRYLTVLVVLLIALIFFFQKDKFQNSPQKDIETLKEKDPIVKKEETIPNDLNNIPNKEELVKKRREKYQKMIEGYHESGVISNQKFRFFGKVVDQFNSPVIGADITVRLFKYNKSFLSDALGGNASPQRNIKKLITLKSDANGDFSLVNEMGTEIEITYIKKEGYLEKYENRIFLYSSKRENEDRVTYTLWKKGVTEPLVKDDKFYGIEPDNRIYTLDLINSKKKEGKQSGDIFVQIKRPSDAKRTGVQFDWTLNIEVNDGGIIPTNDTFLYEAPESGYQTSFTLEMKADSKDWTRELKKAKFYVKSRGGKIYSSFVVDVYAVYNDQSVFNIEWLTNLSGSRNLEYDSSKKIVRR